ncbi:MAG: hypothetical protein AB1942_18650 [Pseudomonadota bacterium]
MEKIFFSFWWLIFPLAFFVSGAWESWLRYRRHKDRLDLLRVYTSQGKDPPPELIRALSTELDREDAEDDEDDLSACGAYGRDGRRAARRYYRHRIRNSPYHAWRTAIITGAVAAGFWIAAEYSGMEPFWLVAVILTCVSIGYVGLALLSRVFKDR